MDAYRAVKLLLDSKDEDALEHAWKRITDITVERDVAGRVAWLRIAAAIGVLRQAGPLPGQAVH